MRQASPNANAASDSGQSTTRHLRGSSVMLLGKMLAVFINLASQVLIVRLLTKDDYGSFAYVLSLLLLATNIAKLGMDRALSRFVPMHVERENLSGAAGVITFVFTSIVTVGGLLTLTGLLLGGLYFAHSSLAIWHLVMILAIVAPVDACDNGLQKLMAIFAKPRSLMFRRHILGPLLKLAAVLPLILIDANVFLLAYGYLAARVLGTAVSLLLVRHELAKAGVHSVSGEGKRHAREVISFSLPLLAMDLSTALRTSLVTLLIEFFHSTVMLASFRAVVPIARLNLMVSDNFRLLFMPILARLHAQNDEAQIQSLYWINAAWVALLSYPLFVVTCLFSEPLTLLLFGDRYRDASTILALLALATYLNASFGCNTTALQALGNVRAVVMNGFLGALAAVTLDLLLIPSYGALGGAIAVVFAQILHNALNQLALYRMGAVRGMSWPCWQVYMYLTISTLLIAGILATGSSLLVTGGMALLTTLCTLRISASALEIHFVFPELQRFAALRFFMGLRGETE